MSPDHRQPPAPAPPPGGLGAILAAGAGARFGGGKLLAPLAGRPLLSWPVAAALAAGLDRVVVVAGAEIQTLRAALSADPRLELIHNPDHAQGMGTSLALAAGLAQARQARWLVVLLGDMPLTAPETIAAVAAAALRSPAGAAAALAGGRRCHPVAFAARHFPALARLTGDRGGRDLLAGLGDGLALVPAPAHARLDVDTPADLGRAQALLAAKRAHRP